MNIPDKIVKLIETFDYNLEMYKKGSYNETQVRREFIDPFFEELGWDITNKQGHAEAYKEVIHEDAIKIGGITKAPDYCFRIGGTRKFFLEAKKPAVNIKEDIHPAYQLRRYGWSAKLPLSILTDFEEFAVYDCRVKPAKTDKVSHSRILYMKYTDYIERWDEIVNIFSPKAILKGSFDKYVKLKKTKKGTAEVDKAFLQEIERWRELLARNIALRNPDLTQRELNFAVQQTIDRVVFLRICEDRGIENYGRLMALKNGNNVYKRLFQLFRKADDKYNSGLFHFKKEKNRDNFDNLTPSLTIDDKTLKDIFKNLYYPDSPYEFSVLPADILGQVYEQFLGKIIRLTQKHQAKIEEKPEVRKAGGVYYTPTYIVDYIVKNTVGKLLEGKKPGPRGGVSNLRILDPACGSGSFLIGAYQFLLDWHRDQYVKDGPEKWAKGKTPRLYQSHKGEWRLTTDERKRILLNNIYGVDIDTQAVEVTKLSLLLKVLEGEDEQSIGRQMALFQERVLPDLANNIKCGNSLIGADFHENQQMSLLDEEEMYRVNAFDWDAEFANIMKNGGFDAVIGNPPYLSMEDMEQIHRDYYYGKDIGNKSRYATAIHKSNLYSIFFERAITLASKGSFVGLITPYSWLSNSSFANLRRIFVTETTINTMHFFPVGVFQDAGIATGIIILNKCSPKNSTASVFDFRTFPVNDLANSMYVKSTEKRIPIDVFRKTSDYIFNISWDEKETSIFDKIEKHPTTLGDIVNIDRGCDTANNQKYTGYQHIKSRNSKRLLSGQCFGRFSHNWDGLYLYYEAENMKADKSTARPGKSDRFEHNEKLIVYRFLDNRKGFICAYDDEQFYCLGSCYVLYSKETVAANVHYLAGILNSKLIAFYNGKLFSGVKVTRTEMLRIPIPNDGTQEKSITRLVENLLQLNSQLKETKLETQRTQIQRSITYADKRIDELVYGLYGLSIEEIKIIEKS